MQTEVKITDKKYLSVTNLKKQVVRSEVSKEYHSTNIHVDNYYSEDGSTSIDYTFTLQGLPVETLEALKLHIDKAITILKD